MDPSHAKAGRPARTYLQQLCEDTGCSPEDLPEAMNDREEWRERVRDIRAGGTTRWWWRYAFDPLSFRRSGYFASISKYLFTKPYRHAQDVIQIQFWSGGKRVWIMFFFS